jgi:hypothetical protein
MKCGGCSSSDSKSGAWWTGWDVHVVHGCDEPRTLFQGEDEAEQADAVSPRLAVGSDGASLAPLDVGGSDVETDQPYLVLKDLQAGVNERGTAGSLGFREHGRMNLFDKLAACGLLSKDVGEFAVFREARGEAIGVEIVEGVHEGHHGCLNGGG